MRKFALSDKFALFDEPWRPKIAASLNGQELKLVKVLGEFPWHTHDDVDELFLVWKGEFRVETREAVHVMGPGELLVMPRGVEHRTAADQLAEVLLFEPRGVVNTGDAGPSAFTAPQDARI